MEKPNSIATVVFLLALLLGALAVGFWLFRSFLQPLAFAIVIGVGFYPFYLWVRRKVRGPNRSALLATVAVLLIFVLPASLIASAAGAQLIKTAQYLGDKQKRVMVWLGRYVDVEELRIQDAVDNLPGQVSKFLLAAGTGLVGGLAGFAGNAILTFLILFFIFRDGEAATSNVAGMLPLGPNQAKRLLTAVRDSIVANLYGILAVGFTQGLLTGAALAVLRVPSALLLGLAAAVCSVLPIVGTALVWVPAAIYLMATGHLWKGIFLMLWGSVIVSTADNIVRPLVIGSRVELHPLLLLFALLGGLQVFGFIGIFIGPLIISLIAVLTSMLREELTVPPGLLREP